MNYKSKKEEMMKKYDGILKEISKANGVDIDTAFDMVKANIMREGNYPYVNEEEFKKDYAELTELAVKD